MPDLLDLYEKAISNTPASNTQNPSSETPSPQEQGQNIDEFQEDKGLSLQGDVTGDENINQQRRNEKFSANNLGTNATKNTRDLYEDPDSWSPEYVNRGFMEETGTSIMRGIGKHIIKGTGDLLQVAGGLISPSLVKGNFLSEALQNAGEDVAGKFQSYMPEDLKAENLSWSSMMQPKFWSTHVAEMIPQLAEFIFLSKGGASVAKGLAKKSLKKLPGASKTALGKVIPNSGSGLGGKLATDIGLTATGEATAGAVGGGMAGNIFSGMLNAAEVINTNKDITKKDAQGNDVLDENGEPVKAFTNEELQEMASGTVKNNATYMLMDMASWGMTFGKLGKHLKNFNPVAKGGKLLSPLQQVKTSSKLFSYDVAPIFKGLGRVAGKGFREGMEEQVQESWEEWAKQKAVNKVTGEGSDELGNFPEFYDFFQSKENEATRVLSFAVGALGGAAFNIKDLVNRKADDNFKLYDRATNLSEIINKQGTEEELSWQQYHIRQTIADIVADDKQEHYDDFINSLVEKGNITEDEKKVFDEMTESFTEVKRQGKNLNVKGIQSLLYNNATENYAVGKIEEFQSVAQEAIATVKQNDGLTENQKNKKITEIEQGFNQQLKATSLIYAEAKQNQANLIIGEKASPLTVDIRTDQYGNEMVVGGLSTKQFYDFTKKGEEEAPSAISLKYGQLKSSGKDIYNTVVEKGSSLFEGLKDKTGLGKKDVETEETTEENPADFVVDENGETTTSEQSEEEVGNKDPEAEVEVEPEESKLKGLEVIDDEVYSQFEETGLVPDEVLDTIAERVSKEAGLSEREDVIRQANKDDILDRVVKKALGQPKKKTRKASVVDNLSTNDVNEIQDANNVTITRTDEGFDITNNKGKKANAKITKAVLEAIDAKATENLTVQEDGDLKDSENDFIQDEVSTERKEGKSIEDQNKADKAKARKKFKANPEYTKDAADKIALDARKKTLFSIRDINLKAHAKAKAFIQKLSKSKNVTNRQDISQNELDNYLNAFTTYNLQGPANIDKMTVVNHQLKQMFPAENPAQVIIARNLFSAVGSQGLGNMLARTIYIDEKAWEQDDVFMHEMSHIYYQLSKDEPQVKKMVSEMLTNSALINKTKELYDDYTVFYHNLPGGKVRRKKGDIISEFLEIGVDPNQIEYFLTELVKSGEFSTIPLKDQVYLVEEMFVAQLQGPLANNFDKVFTQKNEVKRQADTKKFWGLLRKKGDIIQQDDGVSTMLRQLFDSNEVPDGDLKGFITDTFKAVTKGVQMNGFAMDSRVQKNDEAYAKEINSIAKRKEAQKDNKVEEMSSLAELIDRMDSQDSALENDGQMFFDKSFDSKIKAASRILKRFGVVYNKSLRAKALVANKDKVSNKSRVDLFNRDLFESTIFNLATENAQANEFIYNIENSNLKEIQAFDRYLDKVFPNNKLQLLNSMHFVLSNSKHVVGFRNTLNDKGQHEMVGSLSNKELNNVENVIASIKYTFDANKKNGSMRWTNYHEAVNNIYRDKIPSSKDIWTVVEMLAPSNFRFDKVREEGKLTYKGVNIPIETLITGYIKRGFLFNKKKDRYGKLILKNGKEQLILDGNKNASIYFAAARPIIEAMVNTNRKFSPLSSVKNAEGNMEPVRITNNHLTKEVDNMINFLAPDENGVKKTKEEFLDRFSHLLHRQKEDLGKSYVPNQFLDNIYDQYENGILPTISQYHGIEDISNNKGSLYKGSTALEQNIEDLLTFVETSTKPSGKRNSTYLGNMGAFSDSPRKFFMNMRRIAYDEVFVTRAGKTQFNPNGKIINSIFNMHNEIYDDATTNNKTKFREEFRKSVSESVKFANANGNELSKIDKMKDFFKNGKLNLEGQQMVAEYTINSIVNGYNIAETFAPNIKGKDIAKRFKMNSSPIMSVKNPNFKIEPIFFSDELINGSISGTDSAMYILREDAELYKKLGNGVFDMNGGFKFLNASIEKDNPNFKGKTAYLKGYTTIVDEGHPLHALLKSRKDKYKEYHLKEFGTEPSTDLSDGTFNHMAIAVPQSSDKSNFSPDKFIDNKEYTEIGQKFTEEALMENHDEATKYYDELYYDKKGKFLGIDAYNFGPQQLMDKKTDVSNTPVQMINNIIVNATLNGKLNEAFEIQGLLSKQKEINLQKVLDQIKSENLEDYKKLIMKSLNKKDMNQAQRILLEDNGSLAHPYVNEIVVNQLAKTIRREGNKLKTPGTYAHQKPDSGWRTSAKENKALKGLTPRGDGGHMAAEIVLPKHMEDSVTPRTMLTHSSPFGKQAIRQAESGLGTTQRKTFEALRKQGKSVADLMLLELGALGLAKKRFNLKSDTDAQQYIAKETNSAGVVIGYHVKGENVIGTRVPSSKPGDTIIFEVVGFDKGDGNQVMVSSEVNDILGSDNDGDALFIQQKANLRSTDFKDYANWNKAFDKMVNYWLSPEMAEQITSEMIFEEETKEVVKGINNKYPKNNDYLMPFSPKAKMNDYNNTMVSKRNVGPIFNIHKITNMMATSKIPLTKSIKINGKIYDTFEDLQKGNNSRNQQSAILANIILDNAKSSFADAIGLDEYNIAQAVLMVNLGIPLEQVGLILNSPAAKLWSELNRNNSSMFHESKKKKTIIDSIYTKLKIKPNKIKSLKINLNNIENNGQHQAGVIELFSYLADMNSEVQKISTLMGGHNKIHVNPSVLEKQIQEFENILAGKDENKTFELTEDFKRNPDMQNYLSVAKETLIHQKNLNPAYSPAVVGILKAITEKIGGDLSATQIEKISQDVLKFTTSRLLGLNNKNKDYVKNLMSTDPNESESIYNKLKVHLEYLRTQVQVDPNDEAKNWNLIQNSLLFGRAMNLNLDGPITQRKYISANTAFVNDSFSEVERQQVQEEFERLSPELRNDLIMYDMITNGWKGPQSIAPFFSFDTNAFINMAAQENATQNNKELSPAVANKLEKIIALRAVQDSNNPFDKAYVTSWKKEDVLKSIFKNDTIANKLKKGQPIYINVIQTRKGQPDISKLYEMSGFTPEESAQVSNERFAQQRRDRVEEIARNKIKLVPDTLTRVIHNGKVIRIESNIDLSIIEDKNIMQPFTVFQSGDGSKRLEYLDKSAVNFTQVMAKIRQNASESSIQAMDAREDYYIETFTRKAPLSLSEYETTMEFNPTVSQAIRKGMHDQYLVDKAKANKMYDNIISKGLLDQKKYDNDEALLDLYNKIGELDAYAYSIVMTPVLKKLAKNLIATQSALLKKNGLKGKETGSDVSAMKSYLMAGSTIPSNHPASQALARRLETEYKSFINEKKKYMQEMNQVTDALYKERLGYGGKSGFSIQGIKNFASRIKDAVFSNRDKIYQRLYGNLVIREEYLNDQGTLVMNYKLRPVEEIEQGFQNGSISKAEKDFYEYFKKTTNDLMPSSVKNVKTDYIPHTAMNKLEAFSSRGLLGLMANSRNEDHAIYDVKLSHNGSIVDFKQIEDTFKYYAARGFKNDINKIKEYRELKAKAKKLLKKGVNEDGSVILTSAPFSETALGFGAINRFANNRSVKSTELPSMDLNKALGDYIHSSLFVNGNENFQGMEKLQGYIDGVLAWNESNNLPNMNSHVQKVWKDYFLRGKRQTSFAGPTTDRVILGLTRLNLFYALGYSANVNTGGMYAIGNVLAGKYHNIKDIGGKAWIQGELKFWGLDKGFKGGLDGVNKRRKRMRGIMKSLNFMEINVYDEVTMEKSGGLDKIFTDLALSPMILSEEWIQRVHMLGLLTDEQLERFDENGNYKPNAMPIDNDELIRLEDQVKSSHGRGYQPTDQRAVQMYSWGNMMLQFSRFIPTMVHDRFAKEDVNIYGRETIGTLTAVSKMVKYVLNNPKDFVKYRASLSEEQRRRLDSGLKGVAMSTILSFAGNYSGEANSLFWDANYYMNYPKLTGKMTPAPIRSIENLVGNIF